MFSLINPILADSVAVEWSTIGIICGVISAVVGAIVTLSTVYLRLFVENFVRRQIERQNDHILSEVRGDFIRKDVMEERIKLLEDRILAIKSGLQDR